MDIYTRRLALKCVSFFPGNRSERLKESWRVAKIIWPIINPDNGIFIDMGICPECLTAEWLIKDKDDINRCLNCGAMFSPDILAEDIEA